MDTLHTNSTVDKRILIVDDHPISRRGLIQLFASEKGLTVCGEAESAAQAIKLLEESQPDLVTVDISLKDSNGIDLTKTIKSLYPKLPVLVVSMYSESVYGERALQAGASGYVIKNEDPDTIVQAIWDVLKGEIYVSDSLSRKLLRRFSSGTAPDSDSTSVEKLSDRELEVFQLIGEGYSTNEIAKKLYLSGKTVDTYRAQIKQKLNLSKSSELLRYALHYFRKPQ
jgi:DNA-binding NarL/FixJ family response regulator